MQFVAGEMVVKEGEVADVCVRLDLLNNATVLEHDVSFNVYLRNRHGTSKYTCMYMMNERKNHPLQIIMQVWKLTI